MTPSINLDQFRRLGPATPAPETVPAALPTVPQDGKSGRWHAFETDVRIALGHLKENALRQVSETDDPSGLKVSLSVNAVLKAAGRGRTQMYAEHRELVIEIEAAQEAIDEALAARRASGRRPSKTSLKRELQSATIDHGAQIAALASTQMTDLLASLGPALRDRIILSQENEDLKRRVSELETTVGNLRRRIVISAK